MVSNGKTGHVVQRKCISIRNLEEFIMGKSCIYIYIYLLYLQHLQLDCNLFFSTFLVAYKKPLTVGYLHCRPSTNYLRPSEPWIEGSHEQCWDVAGRSSKTFVTLHSWLETNSKVLNTISIYCIYNIYIYVSIQCDVAWRVQQQHQTCIVALEDTPNLSLTDRQVSHIPLPLSLVARLQQFLQDVYRAPRKSSQNRWPEIPVDLFPGRFFTPNLEQTYIYWLRLNFPPPC